MENSRVFFVYISFNVLKNRLSLTELSNQPKLTQQETEKKKHFHSLKSNYIFRISRNIVIIPTRKYNKENKNIKKKHFRLGTRQKLFLMKCRW